MIVSPVSAAQIVAYDVGSRITQATAVARSDDSVVLVLCNFTPLPRMNYVVGVPCAGHWREAADRPARARQGHRAQGGLGEDAQRALGADQQPGQVEVLAIQDVVEQVAATVEGRPRPAVLNEDRVLFEQRTK